MESASALLILNGSHAGTPEHRVQVGDTANNDGAIGDLLAQAIDKVGCEGQYPSKTARAHGDMRQLGVIVPAKATRARR